MIKNIAKSLVPHALRSLRRSIKNDFPYRPYMKKYKCIYIHIPKTAGTSVLRVLMGPNVIQDHLSCYDYQRYDERKYTEYYKFAFVRNPWDRAVSTYFYLMQGGNGSESDFQIQRLLQKKHNSFESFVHDFLNKDSIHEHVLFRPQYLFTLDRDLKLGLDYVGRFEELDLGVALVFDHIGVTQKISRTNNSSRNCYKAYYRSSNTIDRIEYLYRVDVETYGYAFE